MQIPSWITYYGADQYVVNGSDALRGDEQVQALLRADLVQVVGYGIGLHWRHVASADLDPARTWFAHGDPWSALMGVSSTDVVVGDPDLTLPGLAGPPRLRVRKLSDPVALEQRQPSGSGRLTPHDLAELRDLQRRLAASGTHSDVDPLAAWQLGEAPDLMAIGKAIAQARARSRKWIRRCPDCQSPRYGGGCRCAGTAAGIIFD